jgi:hypothetical protein
MKSYVPCDITSCSSLKANRRFGGTCCFHIQGEEKAKHEIGMKLVASREIFSSEISVEF